jgi:dGTPase
VEEIQKMGSTLIDRILEKCSNHREFNTSDTVLQSRLLVRTLIEEANILVIEQTMKNLEAYHIGAVENAPRRICWISSRNH